MSSLHCAAANGHTDVIKTLLRAGARVNMVASPSNRTPLFFAAEEGAVNNVQILVRHGAKLNKTDIYGRSF